MHHVSYSLVRHKALGVYFSVFFSACCVAAPPQVRVLNKPYNLNPPPNFSPITTTDHNVLGNQFTSQGQQALAPALMDQQTLRSARQDLQQQIDTAKTELASTDQLKVNEANSKLRTLTNDKEELEKAEKANQDNLAQARKMIEDGKALSKAASDGQGGGGGGGEEKGKMPPPPPPPPPPPEKKSDNKEPKIEQAKVDPVKPLEIPKMDDKQLVMNPSNPKQETPDTKATFDDLIKDLNQQIIPKPEKMAAVQPEVPQQVVQENPKTKVGEAIAGGNKPDGKGSATPGHLPTAFSLGCARAASPSEFAGTAGGGAGAAAAAGHEHPKDRARGVADGGAGGGGEGGGGNSGGGGGGDSSFNAMLSQLMGGGGGGSLDLGGASGALETSLAQKKNEGPKSTIFDYASYRYRSLAYQQGRVRPKMPSQARAIASTEEK